jgi:chemotaxis protein methyltransferase CheR
LIAGNEGTAVILTESNFESLRDFVYNYCGMFFHTGRKYFLESRIMRRMESRRIKDFNEYFKVLRSPADGPVELKELLIEITTNETCFFRNTQQLAAFERQFLPEVVEVKKKIGFRKLRIWSAGSSSGEEAYTFAMVLLERRPTMLKDWVIEIIGTDISEKVLAQAREAVYNNYSVRNMPDLYRKKYLKEETGGRFILSPEVKKLVTFTNLNLYDDSRMVFMKSFDFIICSNVLIYFDAAAKAKIVQHYYNNLQPYGYFFLGQSESLHSINDKFKTIHFPGGFAYKK